MESWTSCQGNLVGSDFSSSPESEDEGPAEEGLQDGMVSILKSLENLSQQALYDLTGISPNLFSLDTVNKSAWVNPQELWACDFPALEQIPVQAG